MGKLWSVLGKIPAFLKDLWSIPDPYYRFRFACSRLFFHVAGGQARPAFFDPRETFPALLELDRNQAVIRAELDALLREVATIPDYHQVDHFQNDISAVVEPDRHWKVFPLQVAAGDPLENQRRCPRTTALLKRIPAVFAMFSILEPGKSIPAHCGPFLGYLRYHLALIVPAHNPPQLRVKDQVVTWEEGRSLLFDDSHEHEVYNQSQSIRVVLVVDVLRPMPWPFHLLNLFNYRVVYRRTPHQRELLRKLRRNDPVAVH